MFFTNKLHYCVNIKALYVFQLQSMAIFREYQYLKTYTAFLYSLSIANVRMYNASMMLNISV